MQYLLFLCFWVYLLAFQIDVKLIVPLSPLKQPDFVRCWQIMIIPGGAYTGLQNCDSKSRDKIPESFVVQQ